MRTQTLAIVNSFAYVDFADAAGLEKGLALSEQPLLDRNVLIKRAVDFNTTGKLPRSTKTATYSHYDVNDALGLPHVKKTDGGGSASNNAATSTKVFVGNLPFTATRQEVKELFAPLGRVITVRLAQFQDEPKALSTKDPNAATDKSEPRCKGYAHVIFAESSAALDAVAQSKQKTGPGFMLGGKRLRVELGKTPDVAPAVKRKREERVVVEGEVRGVPRGANTKIVFGEE